MEEKDRLEAEARKYGGGIVHLLPLTSGRFAIFTHQRALESVVEITDPGLREHLNNLSSRGRAEYDRRLNEEADARTREKDKFDLSDFVVDLSGLGL